MPGKNPQPAENYADWFSNCKSDHCSQMHERYETLTALSIKFSSPLVLFVPPATPPSEQFNKDKIASQIRSRMGRVLDSVDQKVSPHFWYVLICVVCLRLC
jgi:hypothetical protein